MKKIGIIILALFFPLTVFAGGVVLKSHYPNQYIVQPGDTLWSIAGKYLQKPWQWSQLVATNPHIKNPQKIYPGDVLHITRVNGQPRLDISKGGTVKLSPKIRVTQLDQAIPTIPLHVIKPFLTGTRVVNKGELSKAPYVVAHAGEHVVGGGGDRIYVKGIKSDHITQYSIFRDGKPYVDPKTKKVLGYAADHIGEARLVKQGKVSTFSLMSSNQEVLVGDRLLPTDETQLRVDFLPQISQRDITGSIISVLGGVTEISQFQVVVLDKGREEGMQVGDVMTIMHRGELIRDKVKKSNKLVALPDEAAGEMMVFRVFRHVSYALVLEANRPLHILDKFVTPES